MMKKTRIILLLLLSMAALGGAVRGGHSTLDLVDPSFNPQIQTSSLGCKYVDQIISLPDGKMLVAGTFNTYNRQPADRLARLNTDATLDTTFSSNLPSGIFKNMVVQTDGKILVIIWNIVQNQYIYELIRLNADGTIDTSFNSIRGADQMVIDANGRIIVSGSLYVNNAWRGIARFNSDGSVDPMFQLNFEHSVSVFGTQNNKIIIRSDLFSPSRTFRLNENGTVDPSFITRDDLSDSFIVVQPDGKILMLNQFDLRRLNENGSDDTGFTITTFPIPQSPQQRKIALSADGKITLAININDSNSIQIRRFLSDGTADSTFTPYNPIRFNTLAVQTDGGVLSGDGDGACFSHPLVNDFVRLYPNGEMEHVSATRS